MENDRELMTEVLKGYPEIIRVGTTVGSKLFAGKGVNLLN
jgi:hypothetical protein